MPDYLLNLYQTTFSNPTFAASMLICLFFCLVGLISIVLITIREERRKKRLRENILGSKLISAKSFLDNWKTSKKGNQVTGGYKTLDQPGCYVIVTSPSEDCKSYEEVYVGQSLTVCSRVRNHLTGHGNGDVYADVKYGRPVYVRIIPCAEEEMNDLEKTLIAAFHATDSYNKTAGGSRRR